MKAVDTKSLDAPQSMRKVAAWPHRVPLTRSRASWGDEPGLSEKMAAPGAAGAPCGSRERYPK
jgi:hypothetical protein